MIDMDAIVIDQAPWEQTAEIPHHGAIITEDTKYRFVLSRWFRDELPLVDKADRYRHLHLPFIMHNGSTADAFENDQTILKCCGFATRLGYGGIVVGNLYGARSRHPKALFDWVDPVGADNDVWLARIFASVPTGGDVICAWGSLKGPKKKERIQEVVALADRYGVTLKALKVSPKTNEPHHPLMLSYDCKPIPWRP